MKIVLDRIHPNPHRNIKRNPILKENVASLIASFERNGVWPNVVVRPRPKQRGHYELAYGHNRLEAMRKLGIKSSEFIVEDLSDWAMYTAMVDENESQRDMTPQIVYENIEAGINALEPVIRECETLDEYRACVPRGTRANEMRGEDYARVRNNVLNGEGLGRGFLAEELPGERSTRPSNIQAVVDSHYKATKSKAKEKRAAAKRGEARAAKDKAEADRLDAEAEALEKEARRIASGGVHRDVLLAFDSPHAMTEFASSMKSLGVPSKRHVEAANFLKEQGTAARGFSRALNTWWYRASGKESKDRADAARNKFKAKHREKSLDEFAQEVIADIKELNKRMSALRDFAYALPRENQKEALHRNLGMLIEGAEVLREAMYSTDEMDVTPGLKLIEGGK